MTVPGARRSAGTSHSSLRPMAYCAGCARADLQRAHQVLGQMAAHAVGEDRDLGADVGAGLERAPRRAVPADAAIAGADADHARALVEHLLAGKAHEQIDAGGLDLPGQPLHEVAERDDVVAVVGKRRRRDRQPELLVAAQEVDAVVGDFAGERRALGHEVGHEIGAASTGRAARRRASVRPLPGPCRRRRWSAARRPARPAAASASARPTARLVRRR